jgi:hypothetical protein
MKGSADIRHDEKVFVRTRMQGGQSDQKCCIPADEQLRQKGFDFFNFLRHVRPSDSTRSDIVPGGRPRQSVVSEQP